MADEVPDADRSWPRGWEEHEADQLRRLARLPLWQKLQWLEEMNRIIRHMRSQNPVGPPPDEHPEPPGEEHA
jgi:hypothetical protein